MASIFSTYLPWSSLLQLGQGGIILSQGQAQNSWANITLPQECGLKEA